MRTGCPVSYEKKQEMRANNNKSGMLVEKKILDNQQGLEDDVAQKRVLHPFGEPELSFVDH
jgi:hypothetical protein